MRPFEVGRCRGLAFSSILLLLTGALIGSLARMIYSDDPCGEFLHVAKKGSGDAWSELVGLNEVQSIALAKNGRELLAGTAGGQIERWDTIRGRRLGVLTGPGDRTPITSIAASPDGKSVASATAKGVDFWDLKSSSFVERVEIRNVEDLSYSPDGNWLAVAGVGDVMYKDIREGLWIVSPNGADDAAVYTVGYSPGGDITATANGYGATIFQNNGERIDATVEMPVTTGVDFSDDGRLLAVGSEREILIIEVDGFRPMAALRAALDSTRTVHFGMYDLLLASGGKGEYNRGITFWNARSAARVLTLQYPGEGDLILAMDSRRELLAMSGAGSGKVTLLDIGPLYDCL